MRRITNLLFNDFTNDNRVLKQSKSLQNNGFDILLVATHFDKNLPKEEETEGFKVKRFNVGRIKILPLNLILFWIAILKNFRKEDIFHCNDLYTLPPAYIIKKLFNKDAKIVYDCHEHETEAQIYVGKPLLKKIAAIAERLMIHSTDTVIVVSDSIGKDYMSMYNVNEPVLIMNTLPYKEYQNLDLFRKEFEISNNKIIFLFQGIYKKGRGVETLIEVFQELYQSNKNLVLILLTWGKDIEHLKDLIAKTPNIYLHKRVSIDSYMNYVASADWGILLLENVCKSYDYAMPNKLFDYLMGGLPVVVSNLKEMSKFVRENKVGYTIDPDNKDLIVDLLKDFNKNTKMAFLSNLSPVAKKYCWEKQEKRLLKIYNSL